MEAAAWGHTAYNGRAGFWGQSQVARQIPPPAKVVGDSPSEGSPSTRLSGSGPVVHCHHVDGRKAEGNARRGPGKLGKRLASHRQDSGLGKFRVPAVLPVFSFPKFPVASFQFPTTAS